MQTVFKIFSIVSMLKILSNYFKCYNGVEKLVEQPLDQLWITGVEVAGVGQVHRRAGLRWDGAGIR